MGIKTNIKMKTAKEQIKEAAGKGKKYYSDMATPEQATLVAAMLKEQDYLWKQSVLVDADSETALPDLIAEIIATGGDKEALAALYSKLIEIFVTGSKTKEAYFAGDIDNEIEEQIEATRDPISYLDDIRAQDAAERARDMQEELKTYRR
jgi:hypothetical protein